MRKALALTLALLVLGVAGAWTAAAQVYQTRDQVTFQGATLQGDPARGLGLEVELMSDYDSRLFWTTSFALGEESQAETEYSFSSVPIYSWEDTEYIGVRMGVDVGGLAAFDLEEEPTGMGRAWQELLEDTAPGEQGERVVRVADYLEYYPMSVTLSLPDVYFQLEGGERVDPGDLFPGSGEEAARRIQEYFKIPVLEEDRVRIHLDKDPSGALGSMGVASTGSDTYVPDTWSVLTGTACYFTISTRSQEGKLMDMSQLPEGYGVYCLPYRPSTQEEPAWVDGEGLELVWPLDPETEILDLTASPQGDRLLLHTMEDGWYTITVWDLATREVTQTIPLAQQEQVQQGYQVYDQGDFLVLFLPLEQKLAVLTLEGGTYELEFTAPLSERGQEWHYSMALAFDGQRLAWVSSQYSQGISLICSCDLLVEVYTAQGLTYQGTYRCSLSGGDYGRYQRVSPDRLTVAWTGDHMG